MSPRFVLDKEKVISQYEKVKDACDVVSYSSKTNPIVTGILEKEIRDCMFSIHMKNELKNVKDKSRVIFLAQSWKLEDVRDLVEQGVRWFVVDNLRDLQVFEDFLGELEDSGEKLNLLLRMKLKENTLRTEKYFVFGLESEVINRKLGELREKSRIGKLGVHFHRKTQNMAEWSLKYEFENAIDEDSLGMIDLVCIGGGIPSEYANTNVDVIESVFRKIKEFRDFLTDKGIEMMVEPGRFIAASAGRLKTKIIGVYDSTIIVNASVYNSDLDALVVPVKLRIEGELEKEEIAKLSESVRNGIKAYCVKGVTPCSLDLFRYRVYLPEWKVKEGEELVFLNAGAYNYTTDFCCLEKLETEVV